MYQNLVYIYRTFDLKIRAILRTSKKNFCKFINIKYKMEKVIYQQPINASTLATHCLSMLLLYAYIKEQMTFSVIWVLLPSIILIGFQGYILVKDVKGIKRAKYLVSFIMLVLFVLTFCKAIKNEGGITGGFDDDKWLVRHRKCFQLLIFAILAYVFYSFCEQKESKQPSLFKQLLLNIFSSLSMPMTICSGGACNSIYISTITSVLSSFSVPLTMVVPILNFLAYILQLVGLASIYSANKWKSYPFWIYLIGMIIQIWVSNWPGCIMMIIAVVWNAKTNTFYFGKKQLFKQSVI